MQAALLALMLAQTALLPTIFWLAWLWRRRATLNVQVPDNFVGWLL
jgi:hypothetical protein